MGTQQTRSGIACPSPSSLLFLKSSPLGKHYRSRSSQHQYLLIQGGSECGLDASQTALSKYLQSRLQSKAKYTPQVVDFINEQSTLCSLKHSVRIWLKHPSRTLLEELEQRSRLGLQFQQHQLWSILLSASNALAYYQSLGVDVRVSGDTLHIGHDGSICLSDAYLMGEHMGVWSHFRQGCVASRISQIVQIVQRMIGMDQNLQYSCSLKDMLSIMRDSDEVDYKKISQVIVAYRNKQNVRGQANTMQDQQNLNRNINLNYQPKIINNIECVLSEMIDSNSSDLSRTGFDPKRMKFYRTAPLAAPSDGRCNITPARFNVTADLAIKTDKPWSQFCDISTISSESRGNELEIKTIGGASPLIGDQGIHSHCKLLRHKNREFLQGLILREKNMILEVSETEMEQSTSKSKIMAVSDSACREAVNAGYSLE